MRSSLQLLGTRRFGTFWFASLLSNIGTWAQQVAQPWLLLSLGASPFILGLDSLALGAPVFLLTLVGGALADQRDRRRMIAFFQSIQMLCSTLLVALLPFGKVEPWVVIARSLVVGITDALSMPSFQSIVPSIVLRADPVGHSAEFKLAGISMTMSNASANTLLQSSAPARIRGQTVSLFMLAVRGGVSIGSLATGMSVSLLGVREALLINGVLAALMQLAIGRAWMGARLPDTAV